MGAAIHGYGNGEHHLVLVLENVMEEEIQDVNYSEAEIGYGVDGELIFLFYRFGESIEWSDATINLTSSYRFFERNEVSRIIKVGLYDTEKSGALARRDIELPEDFAINLHDDIVRQNAMKPDLIRTGLRIGVLHAMYNSDKMKRRFGQHFFKVPPVEENKTHAAK